MAQAQELFWWRCLDLAGSSSGPSEMVWDWAAPCCVCCAGRLWGRHWYWRLCPRGPPCPGWCRASAPSRWWCGTRAPPSIVVVGYCHLLTAVSHQLLQQLHLQGFCAILFFNKYTYFGQFWYLSLLSIWKHTYFLPKWLKRQKFGNIWRNCWHLI